MHSPTSGTTRYLLELRSDFDSPENLIRQLTCAGLLLIYAVFKSYLLHKLLSLYTGMPPPTPKYFQIATTPAPTLKPKEHVRPKRKPLLRLEFRDLSEEGARSFLSLLNCGTVLQDAVNGVLDLLYTPHSHIPPTRSVTLILRSMPGVAYTTGRDLDSDHKEIHFSTDYIAGVPNDRRKSEMLGVLRHEMVHCWQWAAKGTCPSGLIEGIADWVRLRSNLVPPHWKREWDGDWDAGYQHTGYFLDYLEDRFGDGTVMKINEHLRDREYNEDSFWMECCHHPIKTLWKDYGKKMDSEHGVRTDKSTGDTAHKEPKHNPLENEAREHQVKHVHSSSDVVSPAEGVRIGSQVSDCGKTEN